MKNRVSYDKSIVGRKATVSRQGSLASAACAVWLLLVVGALPARATPNTTTSPEEGAPVDAAERIARSLPDALVRSFVREALEHNPEVAVLSARARAASLRIEQAQALPDPVLGLTGYISPPETRVGPQRLIVTLSQRFPWPGTRGLREQAALHEAGVVATSVEDRRLELVTEVRLITHEIAYLDAWRAVVENDRAILVHFEELARTRYASGGGSQQGVVKIQAEITQDDSRLLDIATRRATHVASLNALRDRPQGTAIPPLELAELQTERALDLETFRAQASANRPELAQSDAEIARANSMIELAHKGFKPDFTVGVLYGAVSGRPPAAGVLVPPDNGKDIFGINFSIGLPLQRGRRHAGLEEAAESRVAAVGHRRDIAVAIDRSLGELVERLRLTADQVRLYERVMLVQAEQSLRAAEAGYASGALGSLDLLDAERVLLEVRTGAARARADYAIAVARLEGTVGGPLGPQDGGER